MRKIELKDFVLINKVNHYNTTVSFLKEMADYNPIDREYTSISFDVFTEEILLDDRLKSDTYVLRDAINLLLNNQKKYKEFKDNKELYYMTIHPQYEIYNHVMNIIHLITRNNRSSGKFIIIVPYWLSYLKTDLYGSNIYYCDELIEDIIILKKGELNHSALMYVKNDLNSKLFMLNNYENYYQVIKTKSYQEIRKEKLKRLL